MKTKRKSLGQIAYEVYWATWDWETKWTKARWHHIARAVARAVRRKGRKGDL